MDWSFCRKSVQKTPPTTSPITLYSFVYTKLETKEEEQESGEAGSRGDDDEVTVQETTTLKIDRSAKIQGALTNTVFNGEFSPYYCVTRPTRGAISAVAPNVVLQFASSDGNSDIIIDGIKTHREHTPHATAFLGV